MEVKNITKDIFLVENFLSKEECINYINQSEKLGYEEALVNVGNSYKRIDEIRNNDRVFLDSKSLASDFFEKASPFIPHNIGNSIAIGLNELFRFYRYKPKQQFKKHNDESFIRNENEASFYTFLIYLNDDFIGGETTFGDIIIEPKKGSLLIFLHSILHQGNEIKSGVKYVLRTDIMYRFENNQQY